MNLKYAVSHGMPFNKMKDVGRGHGQDGDDNSSDSDDDQEEENQPLIQLQNPAYGKSVY